MMHQSKPGLLRRRVSQPSIHLPVETYLPSTNTAFAASSKSSLGAKNSSLASSTRPPSRSVAKSTRCVKSFIHFPAEDYVRLAQSHIPRARKSCALAEKLFPPRPEAPAPRTALVYGD